MRIRSEQPRVRSYHSMGTQESRLDSSVQEHSGRADQPPAIARTTSSHAIVLLLAKCRRGGRGADDRLNGAQPRHDKSLLSPAEFGSSPTTPISRSCYAMICRGSRGPSTRSCGWKRQSQVSRATWRMIMISTVSCCRAARAIVIMAPPITIRDSSLIPIALTSPSPTRPLSHAVRRRAAHVLWMNLARIDSEPSSLRGHAK